MKIYYKNHNGQILDLMKWPYMISESDILGYEWSYTATEYTGNRSGSTISDVRKKTAKGSVKIARFSQNKSGIHISSKYTSVCDRIRYHGWCAGNVICR